MFGWTFRDPEPRLIEGGEVLKQSNTNTGQSNKQECNVLLNQSDFHLEGFWLQTCQILLQQFLPKW